MHGLGATLILTAAAIVASATASPAACTDDTAVAQTRRRIEARCPCTEAASHEEYVACARRVVGKRIGKDKLSADCRSRVMRCVRRSTCGLPGHVVTCVERESGPRCRVASLETAKPDACLRGQRSCCDAPCEAGSCPDPPLTCGSAQTPGASYPTCGGSCSPGFVCQAFAVAQPTGDLVASGCYCTRPDAPCGGLVCSEDPLEHGACPPGQACVGLVGGFECQCIPPL